MYNAGTGKAKLLIIITVIILIAAIIFVVFFREQPPVSSAGERAKTMTFFSGLGAGWNVGNTLDAHSVGFQSDNIMDYEVQWGNPAANEELFTTVREAGFKSVRIPVTWYPHLDSKYNIDSKWMDRVKEVVDMALEADLYVIINAHHEEWYSPFDDNMDEAEDNLVKLWTQIGDEFSDYDERLIFEGMNEPRLMGTKEEWTEGIPMARENVNKLNHSFVKTIRKGGGNNPDRYLLIPTYCASAHPDALSDFVLPDDDRTALSVHIYLPYELADKEDSKSTWDSDNHDDVKYIDEAFKTLKKKFINKKIPVAITEFGLIDKDNLDDRIRWTEYIVNAAQDNNIPYFWWDNGIVYNKGDEPFAILDRISGTWLYPDIVNILTSTSKN